MPGFKKATTTTPYGHKTPLRSTVGVKYESAMLAAYSVPLTNVDGAWVRRIEKGMVLAKITSGDWAGYVGPVQTAGTDEVQTLTEGTNVTAGTFTATVFGVETPDIDWDATASELQAILRTAGAQSETFELAQLAPYIAVTGGPITTTPFTVTFNGATGVDVPQLTVDTTSLTGTITVATTTAGAPGATDGRSDLANVVGVNMTSLPTQLLDRDVEVAVAYDGTFYQARCSELDANGTEIALTDTTRDQMYAKSHIDCTFK